MKKDSLDFIRCVTQGLGRVKVMISALRMLEFFNGTGIRVARPYGKNCPVAYVKKKFTTQLFSER